MRRAGLAIAAALFASMVAILGHGRAAKAATGCPDDPPIHRVDATPIYKDAAGSITDPDLIERYNDAIRPLRQFLIDISRLADRAHRDPNADLQCAHKLLLDWAAADALLEHPTNFPGVRERQRFAIGINVVALKLKSRHLDRRESIEHWIQHLNDTVLDDFEHRGRIDNLYVWSGVNAASAALVTRDPRSQEYGTKVWRRSLSQIDALGYVPSELRRGARALAYHQYYLSGLLMLRAFRAADGEPTSAPDFRLATLARRVADALCDPAQLTAAAGGISQIRPPPNAFAIPVLFGADLIGENWTRCGRSPNTLEDASLGGRLDYLYDILKAMQNN